MIALVLAALLLAGALTPLLLRDARRAVARRRRRERLRQLSAALGSLAGSTLALGAVLNAAARASLSFQQAAAQLQASMRAADSVGAERLQHLAEQLRRAGERR